MAVVNQVPSVSKKCKVSSMPTFQVYVDGKLVDQVVGFNESKIESILKKFGLSTSAPRDTTD